MPESADVWHALLRAKGMAVAELADELKTTRQHAHRLLTGKRSADPRRDELDRALALGESRSAARPLYGIAVLTQDGYLELLPAGDAQPLFADRDLATEVAESLASFDNRVCAVPVWPDYAWRRTVAFHAAWGSTAEARNIFVVDDPRLGIPVENVVDEIRNGYRETLRLRSAAEDPVRVDQVDSLFKDLPPPVPVTSATEEQPKTMPPSRPAETLPGVPLETLVGEAVPHDVPEDAPVALPQSRSADTLPGSAVLPESRLAETRAGAPVITSTHSAAPVRAGSQIGAYRVTSLLGEGDMAAVYLAERIAGDGLAALKVLAAADGDETARRRFLLESSYAAMLEHPNVPRVYDVGEADGYLYIASEYVPGMNLASLLSLEGWLEPDRALDILGQVASALDSFHARGFVHRDVEPANILIASGEGMQAAGHAYLADFGLGKERANARTALTATSEIVGRSYYTAPEQILGKECDHRTDVYSLGCVLFEALCGEPPFARPRESEILYAQIQDPPPVVSVKRPDLPVALDAVIARALAKEREARYDSCIELIEDARAAFEPTNLWLTVTAGNAAGAQIEVGDEFLIGRLAREEGRLAGDVELSREHARIRLVPEGDYVLEDLGSTNGTYVNGHQIDAPHPIADGDTIEVGVTTLHASRKKPVPAGEALPPFRLAETQAATVLSAPGAEGRQAEPLPRLSLRLDVDWATGEVLIGLDVNSEPIRLVRDGDRWLVAPEE